MDSTKASDRHPLDELLGVDSKSFEEEELTQVLSRSESSEESPAPGDVSGSEPHITIAVEAEEVSLEGEDSETAEDRPTVPGEEPASSAPLAEPPRATVSSAPEEVRDALTGTLVDGRYRVQGLLGSGGIGLVYLCQHELLEKPVAMKVLRPEYVSHKDLNERFMIEARAASSIKSPRIVDTIDVGTLPTGAPYFVMEYVEGETIASLLERDGSVELKQTLEIARQVTEGLSAAHAAGVVHRDLKPENVFLATRPDGALFAKLFDFGIAKVAGARKRLTYVGAVFGTPTYMSPEQARGEAVDERADLYALGIMIFEMLAGRVPFDGEDPLAIMSQHVDRAPPLLSSMSRVPVPPALEALVQRCLEKDPSARYPNAAALLEELCLVDPDSPAPALPVPSPRPLRAETLHAHVMPAEETVRRRGPVVGIAVAAAVIGIGGGYAIWNGIVNENGSSPRMAIVDPTPVATTTSARPSSTARVSAGAAEQVEVHFVLFPLDARVFRGDEDIGQMPVSLNVTKGEPVVLTVRRRGFSTRKVVVDGSETRVVVGLVKSAPEGGSATRVASPFKRAPTRAASPPLQASER